MKKKKKTYLKVLSSVMATSILASAISPYASHTVYAQTQHKLTQSEEIQRNTSTQFPKKQKQKVELKEKRTATKREYLNPDGTITSEVFSQPIHWKNKQGKWNEIDNTLVSNENRYVNKSNAFNSSFSKDTSEKTLQKMEKNQYSVEMSPIDALDSTANVDENKISYANIFDHVDFDYTSTTIGTKEDIVLKNKQAQNSFSFEIQAKNVTPVLNDDHSVSFKNSKGKIIFESMKPFAYDAHESTTNDISTTLDKKDDHWVLTLTIDKDWLSDKKRAFPVVLDPTVSLQDKSMMVEDTVAYSAEGTTEHSAQSWLNVGNNGYGSNRAYLHFAPPVLYSGAKIKSASLKVNQYGTDTNNNTIVELYNVTQPWKDDTLTWNNQPSSDSTASTTVQSNAKGEWTFYTTSIVKDWYDAKKANYGFMLKTKDESSTRRLFYSSEAADPTLGPKLVVTYDLDPIGKEEFWADDNNTNVFNGNLSLSGQDATISGKGIPINIGRVYNSRSSRNDDKLGNGWMFNSSMRLRFNDPMNSNLLTLTDDDGTDHVFSYDGESWLSPPGKWIQVEYHEAQGTEPAYFTLMDMSMTVYRFNGTSGKLESITDENNHVTSYSYNVDGTLKTITDASGRTVTFTYQNGQVISLTGADIPKVVYEYDANGNLQAAKIVDSSNTVLRKETYSYDTNGKLKTVGDAKGNLTNFTYTTDNKLQKVSKDVTENGQKKTLSTQYEYNTSNSNYNETLVTDPKGVVTKYKTNDKGNLISLEEDFDKTANTSQRKTSFSWDQNESLTQVTDPRNNSSSYFYGSNGLLHQTVDSKNNTSLSRYNATGNLIQQTGVSGDTVRSNFDSKGNMINQSNPLAGSSSQTVDNDGNVTEETKTISLADNKVRNSGFERWGTTLPVLWTKFSSNGTFTKSSDSVNGTSSVQLSSSSSSDRAMLTSDFMSVQEGLKYNVNWTIKTNNATTADVKIRWYSDTSTFLSEDALGNTKGTTDWLRKNAQVQAPPNAKYAKVLLYTDTGTAWFDNVQFEEGTLINQYNVVANDGFEFDTNGDSFIDLWSFSDDATKTFARDTTVSNTEDTSLTLKGNGSTKNAFQDITIPGKKGSMVTFSGSSLAQSQNTTGNYDVSLVFDYKDGTTETFTSNFSRDVHDWQTTEKTVTANKDYDGYRIYVRYDNQSGQAWFDDISARTTIVPDTVTSLFNILENSSFEYTDATGKIENWTTSIESGKTASVYRLTGADQSYIGKYAMRISNATGWVNISSDQVEPIKSGKNYVASALLKAEGANGTAGIKIELLDANGNKVGEKASSNVTGDSDWDRSIVSLSEKEAKSINPNATQMRVVITGNNITTGKVYVDGIRFEENAVSSKINYDSNGNYVTSVTNEVGETTTYQVDKQGHVTQQTHVPTGFTANYEYDGLGQLTSISDSSKLKATMSYDANGNLLNTNYIDNNNGSILGTISQSYNELDEVTAVTDQNQKQTTFLYDENRNVKSVQSPNGKNTLLSYNNLNLLTSLSFTGDSTTFDFTYDKNGNPLKVTKNGTDVTDYTYESNSDSLNKITYPSVQGTRNTTSFTYSSDNLLTEITDSLLPNSTKFDYDHAGNVVKMTGNNGQSSTLMYDELGKTKKIVTNDGNQSYNTYFEYNEKGLIRNIAKETSAGTLLSTEAFTYDNRENITSIVYKDGSKAEFQYDIRNQLTEEKYTDKNGNVTLKKNYTYDLLGNRKTMTNGSNTTSYTYDKANQLVSKDGKNMTYDENGNMTSDATYTYVYNAQNQIISVKDGSTTLASYEYNAEGLRTKKVVGSKTEYYYYQGSHLSYVTDGNNKLKYGFTRNADGSLLTMTDYTGSSPVVYNYDANYRGDITGLKDKDGNQVVSYVYDAFGNIVSTSGTVKTGDGKLLSVENPFRYASYYFDEESGNYYLNARYYNASNGKFLTRDSIDHINLYQYGENNPTNNTDPTGYCSKSVYTKSNQDITSCFLKMMSTNAKEARKHYLNVKWFIDMVDYGHPWDIKNRWTKTYTFLGKKITGEDAGNIHFGYVGRGLGLPTAILSGGAGIYQLKHYLEERYKKNNKKVYYSPLWIFTSLDQPRDFLMIQAGSALYSTSKVINNSAFWKKVLS